MRRKSITPDSFNCGCGSYTFVNSNSISGSVFQTGNGNTVQDTQINYEEVKSAIDEFENKIDSAGFTDKQKEELTNIISKANKEITN